MSLHPPRNVKGPEAFYHCRAFQTVIDRLRLPFIMALSSDRRCKDVPQKELATQAALAPAASKPDDVAFDAKEAFLSPAILAVQRGIRAEMRKKPRLHAWLNAQREIVNEARIKASHSTAITLDQQSNKNARPAEECGWNGPSLRPQCEASLSKPNTNQDPLSGDEREMLGLSNAQLSDLKSTDLRLSPSLFEHPKLSAMKYIRVEKMLARVQMRENVKRSEDGSMEDPARWANQEST